MILELDEHTFFVVRSSFRAPGVGLGATFDLDGSATDDPNTERLVLPIDRSCRSTGGERGNSVRSAPCCLASEFEGRARHFLAAPGFAKLSAQHSYF